MSKNEIEAIDGVAAALREVAKAVRQHADMTLLAAIVQERDVETPEWLDADLFTVIKRAARSATCAAEGGGKEAP